MAVKRLPSGVNVDMGFSDESPMDKLNKLLSAVGTVAAGVGAVREQRSTEQLNSIQMLNSVIDNADDMQDLSGIQDRLSNLPYNYDNDAINIATEALQSKFTQKREDFDYIQGLGNDIASFITTPVQFKDSEGNEINKIFGEMTADEIISYTEQTAVDVESRGGMLENITNNMNKIKQLNDSFERQFGQSRKKPRFKFKNSLGADMNISEFNTQMNRYRDQMEIYMDSGLDGGEEGGLLNFEEAKFIVKGDLNAFKEAKEKREAEFAAYIPRATRELDDINQQIIDLRSIEGDDLTSWINISGNLARLKNTLETQSQDGSPLGMQEFMIMPGANAFNDANTMYEDALDDISGMTKTQVIQYLNNVKKTLDGELDINVKAAISWGFGARYGYPAAAEPSDVQLGDLIEKSQELAKERELDSALSDEQVIPEQSTEINQTKQNNILSKKSELQNVKLGKGQLGNQIDAINKKTKEVEQFKYNKKIDGVPIFELKNEFEKDAQEYLNNKNKLEEYKNSGLSRTTGPWYNKKMSDIGLKMQKLEKEMDKFEKKWKTSFTSLDEGAPLSAYVGAGGLYAKLKSGLSQYSKLNNDLDKLREKYNSTKKAALEVK